MLNPIDYSISKFSSFASATTLRKIETLSQPQKVKAGTAIETRGERAQYIYYILTGLIQVGIDGVDGSRFNLTRLGAGHTFGEMAVLLNQTVIHDVRAVSDVTLIRMERTEVRDLMKGNINFSEAMLKVAYMRLQTTLSHIGDTLNISLEARAGKLIYSIYESSGENTNCIKCRQVDLAHGLGVSRVSIGKALKILVNKKLIRLGYGKIEILSVPDLKTFTRHSERTF